MTLKDLDGWLLERVFQPVCDALSRWTTCFGLTRACIVAIVALAGAQTTARMVGGDPVPVVLTVGSSTLTTLLMATGYMLAVRWVERMSRGGLGNPLRFETVSRTSLIFLELGLFLVDLMFLQGDDYHLFAVEHLVWAVSLYLVSCRPRPPRRRTARMTRGLTAGA